MKKLVENCNTAALQQSSKNILKISCQLFENRNVDVVSLQRQNEVGNALLN